MGLDICLIRPCPAAEADKSEYTETGYKYTENPKILRNFQEYVVEIDHTEYDYAAYGHPEWETNEFWDTNGYSFSENWLYIYPGVPGGCMGESDSDAQKYADNVGTYEKYPISDIPVKTVKVKVVPYREVGYQRKGANSKFYADGKWDDPEKIVVTEEELNYDIINYFSSDTPESLGGLGFSTEYNMTGSDRYREFMKNIASKFIAGKTAVMYW